MTPKVFVFGRPGGGKSTIAASIMQKVGDTKPIFHGGDYSILFDMYMKDNGRFFEPADPFRPDLGFNIKNPMASPVWDIALKELEIQTRQKMRDNETMGRDELVILEFARRDYREALQQFSPEFLQNSHFLFVEASVPTSIQRIHKRAEKNGEHFMGDNIIAGYYGLDNSPFMEGYEPTLGQTVACIWNDGLSKEELGERVNNFVEGSLYPFTGKEAQTVPSHGLPFTFRR